MKIPLNADPELQSSLKEIWREIEKLTRSDIDLNGRRCINAGPPERSNDYVRYGDLRDQIVNTVNSSNGLLGVGEVEDWGVVNIKNYGAKAQGASFIDQVPLDSALASGKPVWIPPTSASAYNNFTTLSDSDKKKLFGPGEVRINDVARSAYISTVLGPTDNNRNYFQIINDDFKGAYYLESSPFFIRVKRTGGVCNYGLMTISHIDKVSLATYEFDSGLTIFNAGQNMSGGGVTGAWICANTPSSALSHTFSSGHATGMEINCGNRWADFGFKTDIGNASDTVGLIIVPTATTGAEQLAYESYSADSYPGSFGLVISRDVMGEVWWTGLMVREDSVKASGVDLMLYGGSTALKAPDDCIIIKQYFNDGIDMSSANLSGVAIRMKKTHIVSFGTASITGDADQGINITTGAVNQLGRLSGNNYGQVCLAWDYDGSNPKNGFMGAIPVSRQTVSGDIYGNAALSSMLTGLANLGLITDSTSDSGLTGVTDHGALTGLSDDDHPQYQLTSAKDSNNGYASLGSSGNCLSPGEGFYAVRNAQSNIVIGDRTSGEALMLIKRVDANNTEAYVNVAGSWTKLT